MKTIYYLRLVLVFISLGFLLIHPCIADSMNFDSPLALARFLFAVDAHFENLDVISQQIFGKSYMSWSDDEFNSFLSAVKKYAALSESGQVGNVLVSDDYVPEWKDTNNGTRNTACFSNAKYAVRRTTELINMLKGRVASEKEEQIKINAQKIEEEAQKKADMAAKIASEKEEQIKINAQKIEEEAQKKADEIALAHRKNPINPFGGILWEDSLSDVLQKINAIKDIENIELFILNKSVSVKGISSMDLLSDKIVKEAGAFDFKGNSSLSSMYANFNEYYIASSKIYDGIPQKIIPLDLTLRARPIFLCGIPFDLIVSFRVAIGQLIENPDEVLRITPVGCNEILYVPMAISSLYLITHDITPEQKFDRLKQLLKDKYSYYDEEVGSTLNRPLEEIGYINIHDAYGNSLSAGIGTDLYRIDYSNALYRKHLDKIYEKHLIDYSASKFQGKPDMSSGL